jgi:hypothetical protein
MACSVVRCREGDVRALATVLAAALCAACAGSCGGSGASKAARRAATTGSTADSWSHGATHRTAHDGDWDADAVGRRGAFDSDDRAVLRFGRPADVAVDRAIADLVVAYFRAAAAEDGSWACRLTYRPLARALRQDEGSPNYGPAFARGLTTCPTITAAIFRRFHDEMAAPVAVLAVRVDGDRAQAIVASSSMPASMMEIRRERGLWKIDRLRRSELP